MEQQPKEKDSRSRSRLYPRYDLEESISFISIINRLGGNKVSSQAVAADMGKAINNSTFIGRVSSAKQFGLINQESGKLSLSTLGKEIMYPREETDKFRAIKNAFATPPLYRELIDAFKGRTIPETATLGNRLVHDYGIEAAAKDSAARNFGKSAEYAALIKNGILFVTDEEAIVAPEMPSSTQSLSKNSSPMASRDSDKVQESGNFVFDFKGGIKLIVPRNETTSNAIADGELKTARQALTKFSDEYMKEVDVETDAPEAE